jgi:cobalamin biosynthesis Mg chelatase CobN
MVSSRALEARGYNVVPVFCSGLDMRAAIDDFMTGDANGKATVDALVLADRLLACRRTGLFSDCGRGS